MFTLHLAMCYSVSYNNGVTLIICKEATRVSEQMVPVLQSMQDYIEHHYLDEMMDEIEAVIDMEHRQHLNLGLEQQDDEVLRCVKLAFDRSAGKIVRSAFWRKDRINLRADMKIRIKVAACADGKILHYVIRYICCTADFVLENGIRRIGSVTDVTMGGLHESLQIKSQAPNGTCCKEIWQKVGRKKCSTNKPPQSAGLKREKRK